MEEYRKTVEHLRRTADTFIKSGYAVDGIAKCFEESADTIEQLTEELKQYKDKQEQGLLIIAPCKVGDTIYLPWRYNGQIGIANLKVTKIVIVTGVMRVFTDFATDDEGFFEKFNGGMFDFSDFGEIVFRTEAEAEEALERIKKIKDTARAVTEVTKDYVRTNRFCK